MALHSVQITGSGATPFDLHTFRTIEHDHTKPYIVWWYVTFPATVHATFYDYLDSQKPH